MLREELNFDETAGDTVIGDIDSLDDIGYRYIEQELLYGVGSVTTDWPKAKRSTYQVRTAILGDTDKEADVENLITMTGYGIPAFVDVDGDEHSAYIKQINYDVCASSKSYRLEGHNEFSATGYGEGSTLGATISAGANVRNGGLLVLDIEILWMMISHIIILYTLEIPSAKSFWKI